jgi:NADH:ubiquinone oxidoreductase subunit F (NADH-binding)
MSAAAASADLTQEEPAADGGLPRLLPPPGHGGDLAGHLRTHGPVPYRGSARALIPQVRAAGLTGRGGAAFPVHRKLETVAAARPGRAVVVGNGAEGEPASHKDQALLHLAPHLVLDGLQLAAEAVGAGRVVLYVRHDVRVRARLDDQIAQRCARRLDRAAVEVVSAPARFLAGEESALANLVSGGTAVPRFTPPRVFERGVDGRPTLVQNVETLAHLALIARRGPRWFRQVGTKAEPGSMLCTIRRADGAPHIAEVPLGMPLRALLGDLHDGAVLIGGYHGTWVPAAEAANLTLDNQSLARVGARVGAGILIAPPRDRCGLAETALVVRYLALESAGQCGPCLNGLPRIAAALAELAGSRPRRQTRADVERWAGLVTGRGACHHPDGTARFVRSALATFAAELDRHERGRCSATNSRAFLPIPHGSARTEEDWI